jgi:hypothetical protein
LQTFLAVTRNIRSTKALFTTRGSGAGVANGAVAWEDSKFLTLMGSIPWNYEGKTGRRRLVVFMLVLFLFWTYQLHLLLFKFLINLFAWSEFT